MNETIKELKELIEGMEPMGLESNMSEEDKTKMAKWITALVAKVYAKGLKDGME